MEYLVWRGSSVRRAGADCLAFRVPSALNTNAITVPENELSDGETPEAVLASKQIAAAVNFAMEALSDDLRQAITLREIEGLSYEEIAELMNCPIGTVRSRIFRAREAIALRLRPLLDTREGERW